MSESQFPTHHMEEESQLEISKRNGRRILSIGSALILALVGNIFYGGMKWQHVQDVMENYELRLTRLEGMKADATAAAVVLQNNQIDKLFTIVQTDHDSVVQLKTIVEQQAKRP